MAVDKMLMSGMNDDYVGVSRWGGRRQLSVNACWMNAKKRGVSCLKGEAEKIAPPAVCVSIPPIVILHAIQITFDSNGLLSLCCA